MHIMMVLMFAAEVELIHYVPADGEILIPYNGGTKLTCQAASIPGPQFQWRKNGKSVRIQKTQIN